MWWKIVLIVLALPVVATVTFMLWDSANRKEIMLLSYSDLAITKLKDGTYIGEFIGTASHLRDTRVELVVEKGNVKTITILKGAITPEGTLVKIRNGQSIEDLYQKVLDQKRLDVDVISGATITSKTHLKALEQALLQAQQ